MLIDYNTNCMDVTTFYNKTLKFKHFNLIQRFVNKHSSQYYYSDHATTPPHLNFLTSPWVYKTGPRFRLRHNTSIVQIYSLFHFNPQKPNTNQKWALKRYL